MIYNIDLTQDWLNHDFDNFLAHGFCFLRIVIFDGIVLPLYLEHAQMWLYLLIYNSSIKDSNTENLP